MTVEELLELIEIDKSKGYEAYICDRYLYPMEICLLNQKGYTIKQTNKMSNEILGLKQMTIITW